eukprot:CAMPEP_0201699314 /NCGR_PEP_ID=MMETSP0578-20130828/23295_1 /ASSEMBLY_ACC=CAM_ASM_000663 /TAXON_ID=267565 /ORGANISM="Skeletonema grethea, Strain CCMP 1804" /LENGTH=902 /DNA_ID=CAMNT_0048186055 /DNA_START=199 /DNA_END=2903 /DNA_ORIENTATION=-
MEGDAKMDETKEAPPPSLRHRTVLDYDSASAVSSALMEPNSNPTPYQMSSCVISGGSTSVCRDWQTPLLDPNTSEPESLEREVERLMVLKEYFILDSDREEKFERITALASRIFDIPICLVSLVDIGRQWFMSAQGLGDVRETSREVSFCSHALLSESDVFIVPETFDDPRFVNNGLVTGPPFIRFYAGVPLNSPEGYKLGTFCIIDSKPRPNGLSLNEKQNLRELADMVMDTMVSRKKEMDQLRDEKTRLIACAAHDLLTPLTGIQLNLGLLMEDKNLRDKLDPHQRELMDTSVKCSEMIERICFQAIETFRGELVVRGGQSESSTMSGERPVKIDQLVENLNKVVSAFPKKVPFYIEKEENVPATILSDELKLFRSIMNYLTNAFKHTDSGSIRLHIYVRKASESITDMELDRLPGTFVAPKCDVLVVEVHDTGPGIDLDKYSTLFTPNGSDESAQSTHSGIGLYSVATAINSLGGECGVFPRKDLTGALPSLASTLLNVPAASGSVFWFSIPLKVPECGSPSRLEKQQQTADGTTAVEEPTRLVSRKRPSIARSMTSQTEVMQDTPMKKHYPDAEVNDEVKEEIEEMSAQRVKRVLIVDDSLTIRKALSKGFSRLGFAVDEAENGMEGLKKLRKREYNLVLLDFLMPVLDGVDVAKKFRSWEKERRPWFHQYIIGMSAHANGNEAELGIKSGMDRFMGKPIPLKSLKDIATCKPVLEADALLEARHKQSLGAILDAADRMEKLNSDDERSRSSVSSSQGHSSVSDSLLSAKATCLIVENTSDRSIVRQIAEKSGFKIVAVRGGDDAIRLLKMRNWGIVFIDNNLPLFSGSSCIVRFRDWEKRSRVVRQKNIFLLADNHDPNALQSGVDGTLGKPVDPMHVHRLLEKASKEVFQCSREIL